jgi:hypothetical protein
MKMRIAGKSIYSLFGIHYRKFTGTVRKLLGVLAE